MTLHSHVEQEIRRFVAWSHIALPENNDEWFFWHQFFSALITKFAEEG